MIEAVGLSKAYPGVGDSAVEVLHGVSLSVEAGEMVAIVGPSGSGKSTLLYCLSGLEAPTAGAVRIGGVDLGGLGRREVAALRREKVGFVFQSYNLLPSLSVRDNVGLPARLARRRLDPAKVERTLAELGLQGLEDSRPGALSGGQQQRVAIARVLVSQPGIVFADEPTGALDTASGGTVLDLLRAMAAGERSVVMVTHDLDAAARADRVLVLRDGVLRHELRSPDAGEVFAAVADTEPGRR